MLIALMVCLSQTFAQDVVLHIIDQPGPQELCIGNQQNVIIYAQDGCESNQWIINGIPHYNESSITITPQLGNTNITYNGCNFNHSFWITYYETEVPNEFTRTILKHQGYVETLEAVEADSVEWYLGWYNYQWNTGETTPTIDVIESGTYTCTINDMCGGPSVRTFIVKDNVELYRATVDLETKLNKVTWQTTPEQAEYVSEVKVERDGMVVGSAPYEQGYFLDNIGSENAARNYRLTAIATDGTECPIPSYQKGTLHVDYSPNASNPNKLNMAWTPPFIEEGAPISVSYFQICKYDPETNEVTVVDQLGANNTIGSYDVSLFDGGYAVVAAMFNEGKEYEELSFSNLTDFLVGIEENEGQQCRAYPNPAKDRFTVEGTGTMTVTNALGQTVMTKEIDGKATIELPQGIYFVKLGGATRKIVVE